MTGRLTIPGDGFEVLDDFIVKVAQRAAHEEAHIVERRIRLLLQPKPRWMPERVYRRVLSRLLTIEITL